MDWLTKKFIYTLNQPNEGGRKLGSELGYFPLNFLKFLSGAGILFSFSLPLNLKKKTTFLVLLLYSILLTLWAVKDATLLLQLLCCSLFVCFLWFFKAQPSYMRKTECVMTLISQRLTWVSNPSCSSLKPSEDDIHCPSSIKPFKRCFLHILVNFISLQVQTNKFKLVVSSNISDLSC